jgi:hypothetical protein
LPSDNAGVAMNKAQVLAELKARYFGMLPSRFPNRSIEEQRRDQFSRSLAAFAIQKLAGCNEIDAVSAVVDCGDDNGIDAIYFDRGENILWLAQAKYGDAPDRGANQLFCSGINDILSGRYDRFYHSGHNREFDRVRSDVEDALSQPVTRVVACVVYLGNPLGPHAIDDLNVLQAAQNRHKPWFEWRDIGLPMMHGWLTDEQALEEITVDLVLENWNTITQPRRAVYGLVCASQLSGLYERYGNALFQQNIRYYLGDHDVNAAISETVHAHPDELFYLNNGLTIICSHYDFVPPNNTDRATFTLNHFSIVNGAQTVGSFSQARRIGEISVDAKIMVTILEIGIDENSIELGRRITRARNTQNSISREDFAALDPNQERLRQELAISDVVYHYRPSADTLAEEGDQFSLADATRALACFSCDTAIIVIAKKEIGQISDRNGAYYSRLFRNDLTGTQLYRKVQIYQYIDHVLRQTEDSERGRRQTFFRHGRYFIMHIWARSNQPMLNKAELILSEDDKLEISRQILDLAEQIWTVAEAMFAADPKGYLTIFRNFTDAEPLAQAVMSYIHQAEEA